MKTPELTPIEKSSTLAGIHHDQDPEVLYIQFKDGRTYAYAGVPADVADAFHQAESKGGFFHSTIKKGGYPYMRLDNIKDDDEEAVAAAHKFLKGAADERAA